MPLLIKRGVLRVILLGQIGVLTACGGTVIPAGAPAGDGGGTADMEVARTTASPGDPTGIIPLVESDGGADGNQHEICQVRVVKSDTFILGLPTPLEVTYVAKDGTVQHSSEVHTGGTIMSLQEGRVSVAHVLQRLDTSELWPASLGTFRDLPPGVVSDGFPPRLTIEVSFCDAPAKVWGGNQTSVPPSVRELVQTVKSLVEEVALRPAGEKFIRSLPMEPGSVQGIRDRVVSLSRGQLEDSPLLREAILNEHRLVKIPSDNAPYARIEGADQFEPDPIVEFEGKLHRIRHLTIAAE